MKKRLGLTIGAAAVTLAGGLAVLPAQANDITSYRTEFATDVVYAGLGGLRGVGTGSITVAGVTGTVTGAELYWHGPTDLDTNAIADVTFAGSAVTGTHIGESSSNCWEWDNSQAYRADVSSLVTGNGSYTVADLIKPDADINGVGLVVFFDDGDDTNDRDVVMFDGNDSNVESPNDAAGWDVSLPGIAYESGSASLDLLVADGQSFSDGDLVLDGNTIPAVFNGDTVPDADAGSAEETSGGLWDQRTYDITADLSVGDNTVTLTHQLDDDCLSLVMAAVNLPAGAAPNQPTTTTTTTTTAPTTSTTASTTTSTIPAAAPAAVAVTTTATYTG